MRSHLAVALAATSVVALAQAPGRKASLAEFSGAIEELAAGASPAVVQITAQTRTLVGDSDAQRTGFLASQKSTGSGVIIDAAGYIVTNAHVIEGARHIDVSVMKSNPDHERENHTHYAARLVGEDRDTDLALLKVDGQDLPALAFADSAALKQGQFVIALGSPLGLNNSLSVGFISAPIRHLRADSPMFYIQTDAAINPGNSGGPLLDLNGHIAGINTLILSQSGGSEGIGFAIPANLVKEVCARLRKDGRVRRAAIGVIQEDISTTLAAALNLPHHTGVILSDVAPHSAAEAAGLQTGDVVVGADGKPIRDSRQFMAALFQHAVGDELKLTIERDGKQIEKTVVMMERQDKSTDLTELANLEGQLIKSLGILALPLNERTTRVLPDLRRLSGVVVGAVPAEYVSSNPGLTTGDVIYECNGQRVTTVAELEQMLKQKPSGSAIALLVERSGQLIYVSFETE